jgi:hypothetical protein
MRLRFMSYQRSQRATFGAVVEFLRNRRDSENLRVEPTAIFYDRWYRLNVMAAQIWAVAQKLAGYYRLPLKVPRS